MKVVFITRSTLFESSGGDTIQVLNTAKFLKKLNVDVDIKRTNERINYEEYDILHFFSLIRPADILPHIRKSKRPFVVTPLLIDYSEFDKYHRKGIVGKIFHFFSSDQIEYLKTIARWIKGQQHLGSYAYLVRGQRAGIKDILRKASLILPNSMMEYYQQERIYAVKTPHHIVPNGIDASLLTNSHNEKDKHMVLSVARIEGLKNQLNLIKALNNSEYQLYIIGKAAVNQKKYYAKCRNIAAENIHFINHLPQEELTPYYEKAKVHILPSWFETCGLSSLEAAAMGCNIVITKKGYATEYFHDHAFYCDPASPASIMDAINRASTAPSSKILQRKIFSDFTWQNAAAETYEAYKKILST